MPPTNAIPGHVVGPGQQKARLKKLLPRPSPSGKKTSGCRARPSLNLPNLLPRPGPTSQSGQISLPKPGPSGQNKRSGRAIFGPSRVGPSGRAAHAQVGPASPDSPADLLRLATCTGSSAHVSLSRGSGDVYCKKSNELSLLNISKQHQHQQ
jgi:hypothetical protein